MSLIALLGFVTVVLLALLLLNGYLWWRLVRSTTRPGRARRGLTALLVVLGLLPALAIGLRGTLPRDAATPLDWVAYSWLGIAFYLFLALLVLEPVRLLLRPWTRSRARGRAEWGPEGPAQARRRLRRGRLLARCRPAGRRCHGRPGAPPPAAALPRAGAGRHRRRGRPRHRRDGRRHRELRPRRPPGADHPSPPGPGAGRAADRHVLRRPPVGHLRRTAVRAARRDRQRPAAGRGGDRRGPRRRQRRGAARGRRPARRPGQRAGRLLRHRQPRVLRGHPGVAAAPADAGRGRAAQRAGRDPPGDGDGRPGRDRRPDGGVLRGARPGRRPRRGARRPRRRDARRPPGAPAGDGRAGAGGGGGPPAVRPHPRRAAVALRLRRSASTSPRWRGSPGTATPSCT